MHGEEVSTITFTHSPRMQYSILKFKIQFCNYDWEMLAVCCLCLQNTSSLWTVYRLQTNNVLIHWLIVFILLKKHSWIDFSEHRQMAMSQEICT